jgi:hypothetical protein
MPAMVSEFETHGRTRNNGVILILLQIVHVIVGQYRDHRDTVPQIELLNTTITNSTRTTSDRQFHRGSAEACGG